MNAYSFLPWLRRGIASQITLPPGAGTRASVAVPLHLEGPRVSGSGTLTADVTHPVSLYGPGDVVGLDQRAVVRTDPLNWVTNFDSNHLPFVEFYDEDFPWRYSPDVADPATGRLRPWLALVVLTEAEFSDPGAVPGKPLPFVSVPDLAVLPPADQLGAWAHVHVNRTITASDTEVVSTDMAAVLPRLAAVIAENPDLACSRVICPRHLEPQTAYHAFLVPAFETERLAGLGLDPAGSPGAVQSSWVPYTNRPEPDHLCYYLRWTFRTSDIGDFEYLARLLKPRPVDERVGTRDMDVRDPGAGLPGITDPKLGGVLWLGGALRVPDADLDPQRLAELRIQENWDQPYPVVFEQALANLINLGDDYTHQPPSDPDPLVTPPLYGRWHALTNRLLHAPDGTDLDPNDNWVHRLNLDPRFRVAAGMGARVVRAHQDEFMRAAWQQLGDVLTANKRLRAAQVAREVGFRLHDNHLAPLAATAQVLALTAPVQSRVVSFSLDLHESGRREGGGRESGPRTAATAIAASVVARTPLSPAMRRATRPGGRLVRGLFEDPADRHQLLGKINSRQIAAAPPKTAPTSIVTVDALESAVSGPIILIADGPAPIPDPVGFLATSGDFVISGPGDNVHPTTGDTDSAEAARFKQALHDVYTTFNVAQEAGFVPPRPALDLDEVRSATMDGIHPDFTVPRRAFGAVTLPPRLSRSNGGDGLVRADDDPLAEVMAYPVIDLPMFRPLRDLSPDWFLPNLTLVPHDSVTLLDTNRRFVESYLVGLNHEMAREMLWREFPTDQRGSVFRQFWDVRAVLPLPGESAGGRRERLYDIVPIDQWPPRSALGEHGNGTSGDEVVLVIRGELLKKYPTAVIYAHRAEWQRKPDRSIDLTRPRRLVTLTPAEEATPPPLKIQMPLYDAKAEPDIYFFGFDLTEQAVRGGTGEHPDDDPGWFFVIKERPGDPRFGLDVERDTPLRVWNDLAWPDVLTTGDFLRLDGQTPTLTLTGTDDPDLAGQHAEDVNLTWNQQINAADLAYVLYRAPVLVAIHAREMLGDA